MNVLTLQMRRETHFFNYHPVIYETEAFAALTAHVPQNNGNSVFRSVAPKKFEPSRTRCHGAMAFTSWLLKDFSDSLFRCWIYYTEERSSSSPWPHRVPSNSLLTVSNGIQYLEHFCFSLFFSFFFFCYVKNDANLDCLVMYHHLIINLAMVCEGNNGKAYTFQESFSPAYDLFCFFHPTECRSLIKLR